MPDDIPATTRDRARRKIRDGRASIRLLITAGPTHEPIDPVRSIVNRSSGRLGVTLAAAAAERGWPVRLLAGPGVDTSPLTRCRPDPHAATSPPGPDTSARHGVGAPSTSTPANDQNTQIAQAHTGGDHEQTHDDNTAARRAQTPTDTSPPSVERFQTAADLERLLGLRTPWADALVMAAAVADYRPSQPSPTKLARSAGPLVLRLEPVADLLARACAGMRTDQVAVGFALEDDPADHARALAKMAAKGCQAIVLNPVTTLEADHIDATILFADGRPPVAPGPMPKVAFAPVLLDAIEGLLAGAVA